MSLKVSHNLAMFGGHWCSANRDIKYSICPMLSQNHMTEGSCDFMSGSSHSLGGHNYCSRIDMVFILSRDLARPRGLRIM